MRAIIKPWTLMAALFLAGATGCGGGGGSGGGNSLTDLGLSASPNADAGSSYENRKTDIHVDYSSLPYQNQDVLKDAIAYLDANGDGNTDVFMGTGEPLIHGEEDSELFVNNGSGGFTFDNSPFNGDPPPATHARKTLIADFDGNSLPDLFILDQGLDADPFPGNDPKLIMQESAGSFTWRKLTDRTGFHHGGGAADIDNDGDIDIFVGGHEPFFYVNDGSGSFDAVDNRFATDLAGIFTAALIDVDEDGFVDLLVGGHEHQGDRTTIYWGNTTGSYSADASTRLPTFNDYGTVLDFLAEDYDGDGDRDIVVNRTGGGNDNFYEGRQIQLLLNDGSRQFSDVTASRIDDPGQADEEWVRWLRAQDYDEDGHIDFYSDNEWDDWLYLNQGDGTFERNTFP